MTAGARNDWRKSSTFVSNTTLTGFASRLFFSRRIFDPWETIRNEKNDRETKTHEGRGEKCIEETSPGRKRKILRSDPWIRYVSWLQTVDGWEKSQGRSTFDTISLHVIWNKNVRWVFFRETSVSVFLNPSLSLSPSFFLFGLFLLLFLMSVIDSFANFFYRETDVYMVLPFKSIRLLSKYICNILLKLLFEDQCVVSKLMFSVWKIIYS